MHWSYVYFALSHCYDLRMNCLITWCASAIKFLLLLTSTVLHACIVVGLCTISCKGQIASLWKWTIRKLILYPWDICYKLMSSMYRTGGKPVSKPMMPCYLEPWENCHSNLNKTNVFIQENSIYKMAVPLSRPQCIILNCTTVLHRLIAV